ncbi:MAG: hypothetical protein ABFD50_08360 [Smithella sp.]
MKKIIALMAFMMLFGCAHNPVKYQLAPGSNQDNFKESFKSCGGSENDGYFLFGPLIILAPVVAVVESVKHHKRHKIQDCMEEKGYKCLENCPHKSTFVEKPVDPSLIAKWEVLIKEEKTKEWVHYADDPKGSQLFYNPQSLSVIDQRYISYRDQVKFSPERKDIGFEYVWRTAKINCADKIFKLLDFVASNKNGNATDPKIIETEWKNLPESSPIGIFSYKMCAEKKIK